MAIGHALQKGTLVYIYDHNGEPITSIAAPGRWPDDGLKGYTPTQIMIQKGSLIYTYNEKGKQSGTPYIVKQTHTGNIQFAKRRWQPPLILSAARQLTVKTSAGMVAN